MQIQCDQETQRFLWRVALARTMGKIASTNRACLPERRERGNIIGHYDGCKGEWSGAKATGVPWDGEAYGVNGDRGVDLWIHGHPFATKFNHCRGGYGIVELPRDLDERIAGVIFVQGECQHFRFCRCKEPVGIRDETYTVAGWLWREEFWERARCTNWGLGPRWWVTQDTYHPISWLTMKRER